MLNEETAVPQGALPLDEFKAHLRLGTGFAEGDIQDAVLETYLRAAIAAIEARTGKILIMRSFRWQLADWRDQQGQPLPVAPVETVTGVMVLDRDGLERAADPGLYSLRKDAMRPVLQPRGGALPAVPSGGHLLVRFEAGMGADWGALPADLGHAVLLLASHYYEFRHEMNLGDAVMPYGVSALIERYRTVRLLGGGVA